jgi:hypothetical protein
MADEPKSPADLGTEGKKIWRSIARDVAEQGLALDARELVWLRSAGKIADRIALLEAEIDGADMIVPGYNGQPTANPLLAEIRLHSQLLAQTLARLRVDAVETASGQMVAGNRHRTAALSRWYPNGSA